MPIAITRKPSPAVDRVTLVTDNCAQMDAVLGPGGEYFTIEEGPDYNWDLEGLRELVEFARQLVAILEVNRSQS